MKANVYFINFKASSKESMPQKIERLINTCGIKDIIKKKDMTAIKLHFGEKGNTAFIFGLLLT